MGGIFQRQSAHLRRARWHAQVGSSHPAAQGIFTGVATSSASSGGSEEEFGIPEVRPIELQELRRAVLMHASSTTIVLSHPERCHAERSRGAAKRNLSGVEASLP